MDDVRGDFFYSLHTAQHQLHWSKNKSLRVSSRADFICAATIFDAPCFCWKKRTPKFTYSGTMTQLIQFCRR